ncbi:hypothetical protein KL86DPRO_20055 [uncultured delta proteobacterium]|uniref:Uncharacterized protein n=1 Tax=uncultured delta proteobacterium TaxID=34034 RepID=A0A212JU54_9DELT|nr:hypothetical protein KL86DPRO_20055 [uncultured delta proteobacterium]
MKVAVHEHEKGGKELRVSVPWSMIEDDYDAVAGEYAKVPLKGFRPGKAPPAEIFARFGAGITNGLLSAAGTRLCRAALKKAGLAAGSPVTIADAVLKRNDVLEFTATFIEMPCFELPDYLHLDLQAQDVPGRIDEISLWLLHNTTIALPEYFVAKELLYTDAGTSSSGNAARKEAEDRVKLMLILKKIADRDGLEVSQQEITERTRALADEHGMSLESFNGLLAAGNGLGRLADSLLAEKVLAYLSDAAH